MERKRAQQSRIGIGDTGLAGGDIDALTAPSLAEALFAAQAERPSAVIVDLSTVDFLASAGMTVLIDAHQKITPGAQFLVVAEGAGTAGVAAVYDGVRSFLMALTDTMRLATSTTTATAARGTLAAQRDPLRGARCGMRAFKSAAATAASGTTKSRTLTNRP